MQKRNFMEFNLLFTALRSNQIKLNNSNITLFSMIWKIGTVYNFSELNWVQKKILPAIWTGSFYVAWKNN